MEENELFDLRRSLETICNIVRFLNRSEGDEEQTSFPYPALHRLAADVMTFPQLVQRIDQILDKFGKIRDNASPELATIRHELAKTEGSTRAPYIIYCGPPKTTGSWKGYHTDFA